MGHFHLMKPERDHWYKPKGKRLPLENCAEPDLFREYFPYDQIPKIPFDGISVPMDIPEDIWITCTTFRDGQQARPPYTIKQIENIYTYLHRLGGPNGVIRQCEFFLYSDKDKEAVRKCLEKDYRYPEVTGWIRAVQSDFRLVKEMGLKETGILTSVSDYHIFLKLGINRKQAMEKYTSLVKTALDEGIIPRCHLEDVTRADIYGFVVPFTQELMRLSKDAGIPVKVRLCDTMGYGVPQSEAALPRSIPKLIQVMHKEAGVPKAQLEWHGHNDFHKVLVNGTTAWLYGCAAMNGALLGFGERTGNPPIEGACVDYASLTGSTNGMDLTVINEIADYFRKELKTRIPGNYPFVGETFNVTRAGIHADGVIKNEEIYNIFDTKKILNRPLGISITDKSGVAGICLWLNTHLNLLEGHHAIPKDYPGLKEIYEWVQAQYEAGRTTAISPEEIIVQGQIHLPEYFKSDFDKLKEKAKKLSLDLIEEVIVDPAIRSMEPEKQEEYLKTILKVDSFIQLMYVTDTTGKKITKNITPEKIRDKYEAGMLGEDFSDRDWFINPMRDGLTHVTDFYKSRVTGSLCITVSAPVRNDRNDIVGILGFDIKFEELVRR